MLCLVSNFHNQKLQWKHRGNLVPLAYFLNPYLRFLLSRSKMAENLSNTGAKTESCGYCLEGVEKMVDRRRLPCGHEFCLSCLKAHKALKGELVCATCRYRDQISLK